MLLNLFGKKEYPLGTEQYEFVRTIGTETFTILVDMKYEEAFLLRKTHATMIVIAFTGEDASKKIDELSTHCKHLIKNIKVLKKAVLVGMVQGDKVVIGYIMTESLVPESIITEALTTSIPYTITFAADPDWTFIRETLFPSDAERQQMNNKNLLALLAVEQGDNATAPTSIEHTVGFKAIETINGFSTQIESAGYTRGEIRNTKDKTYPFHFLFYKQGTITLPEVTAQTNSLIQLATTYNGHYEGWQGRGGSA